MHGIGFLRRRSSFLGALVLSVAVMSAAGSPAALASPGTVSQVTAARSQSGPVAAQSGAPDWETAWSAAPVDMGDYHYTGTVRDVIFTSVGGNTVRIRLSNVFGTQPYEFGEASIGVSDAEGNITGAVVPLTFNGQPSVTIPQGGEVLSDPVSLTVPALHDLAVSVYVPADDGEQTGHPASQQINYVTEGTDNVMDQTSAAYGQLNGWFYVDSVDVTTQPRVHGTVVALGDSITDGINSTVNANTRWPNDLARRLDALRGDTMSVADEGISANQVLGGGGQAGVAAVLRFNRDVVQRAGAKDVILLEGVNDIGTADASASAIIAGDEQLIADARAAGLKIFGATLTPFKGASYWSPAKEQAREALNQWIRTSGAFDGVIDFAKATEDPSDPEMYYPPYDSGDHLHPDDAGYQAMASAVNLAMLLHPAPVAPVIGYLPSQDVTVAPGGRTTVQVSASNTTGQARVAHVSLTPPAGLQADPASADITVPAHGSSSVPVSLSAAASARQGFYRVPVAVTGGGGQGSPLDLTVLAARPGSLLAAVNNTGISDDTRVSAADFDLDGDSYSAQALAAAGLSTGHPVTVHGITFSWPAPDSVYPDNVVASGQQVTVHAARGTRTLGFLGSATNGPSQGVVTVHYSDGSSAQFWLGLSDWTLNSGTSQPSYGNQTVAAMAYRNCDTCTGVKDAVSTNVFYAALPVNPGKMLTSVTLPATATQGPLHIFAVGTGTGALTPAAQSVTPATASPGQRVTVTGTGFGTTQGSGYVDFTDNGTSWGAPGSPPVPIDSWSDTAVTFTVPAPSGAAQVSPDTTASVSVVTASGTTTDSPVLQIPPSANPADYYDNTGISPDSDQACADFDGLGFSYSADALAAAGVTPGATITAGGLTFAWPDVASCAQDNILAAGQTILLSGQAGATTLGLLGSSSNGAAQGTVVINYTDGTSTTQTVSFNDWANGPGNGDTAAVTMGYRNSAGGSSQTLSMYVYATTVPVDPAKTVAAVVLPDVSSTISGAGTAMHIFALALGS
jgi:lysophospholipase L1-like esterase